MQRMWINGRQGWMIRIPLVETRRIFLPDTAYEKKAAEFKDFKDVILGRANKCLRSSEQRV